MHRTAMGALVMALVLGTAGCGGSDPPTRAEFAKQADAVCARARAQVEPMRVHDALTLVEKFMAYERRKANGIEALAPPAGLDARFAEYRRTLRARVALFASYAARLRAHHRLRTDDVKGEELEAAEREFARALHLTRCLAGASG